MSKICPYCNGGLQEIIRHGAPTQGSASHYSRIECIECGRFVRWGKAPHTIARLQVWKAKVQKLSQCKNLSQWQAQFWRGRSSKNKRTFFEGLVVHNRWSIWFKRSLIFCRQIAKHRLQSAWMRARNSHPSSRNG